MRKRQSLCRRQDANRFTILVNQADFTRANALIDARFPRPVITSKVSVDTQPSLVTPLCRMNYLERHILLAVHEIPTASGNGH